jgi:ABC-type transport system substrate-binding protein
VPGLLVVALLPACSAAGGDTGTPPKAPDAAHRGGVLRVGITTPGGIDPTDAYEAAGKLVSTTMCDTLVAIDPETGQVREALAKGWVVPDGTTLTVKLRHGIRFTDGQELKAKDVNYSLQQLVSPTSATYAAGLGKQFAALQTGKQGNDLLADPDKALDVAFSVNRFDLQLTSRVPDGGALRSFAEPAMAPISRSARVADVDGFDGKPVCVGPYELAKPYTTGDAQIRLVRTKRYYADNVGYTAGGVGYADEVVFTIYPTAAAALEAYRAGLVDVVRVPRDLVAQSPDAASRVFGLANGVEYVGLPGVTTGPLSDADERIALSQAIDRTALVVKVFGPAAQPATGFEPPALAVSEGTSLGGKTVNGVPLATCGTSTPATPDLASARAGLARAAARPGAKPLTGFTLEVNDDAPYPALARELAAQWKSGLGLDVKVVTTPWDAYTKKAVGSPGFTSPFRIRWSTDAIAPAATFNGEGSFLSTLFSQDNTGLANWAHFNDRTFAFGLASKAGIASDVGEMGAAYAALASQLCKEMPIIPVVVDRPTYLVRSTKIGSARTVPVGRNGVLLLRELYLR